MIILQHNAIKASFQKSLHVVRHRFKVTTYKKLLDFVSKYALNLIAEELDKVKSVGFDKNRCGECTLTCTHACHLTSFGVGCIPFKSVHAIWTQLSLEDLPPLVLPMLLIIKYHQIKNKISPQKTDMLLRVI